jgi:phosphoenolpyruvate phosphomutase
MSLNVGSEGIIAIGARDCIEAAQAHQLDPESVIWLGSWATSSAKGLPDEEHLGAAIRAEDISRIKWVVPAHVILDGDSGGPTPEWSQYLALRTLAFGGDGLCIEDVAFGEKKNSLLFKGDKRLCDPITFCQKISAMKEAVGDQLSIIARTEAFIVGCSLEEAVSRAVLYGKAGADFVLVHSRSSTVDELLSFAKMWQEKVPLACIPTTCGGQRNLLAEKGYRLIILAHLLPQAQALGCHLVAPLVRRGDFDALCLSLPPISEVAKFVFNRSYGGRKDKEYVATSDSIERGAA